MQQVSQWPSKAAWWNAAAMQHDPTGPTRTLHFDGSRLHAMKLLNSNQNVEAFGLLFRPRMFEKEEIIPFARCTKGSKLNWDGERRLWSLFLAAQRHRLRPEQQLKLLCARMHLEGNLWFATFATLPSSPYTLAWFRCSRSAGKRAYDLSSHFFVHSWLVMACKDCLGQRPVHTHLIDSWELCDCRKGEVSHGAQLKGEESANSIV